MERVVTNPTTSVRTTARAATVALQPVFWRLIFGLLICHLATDRSFGQTDDEPQFDEIVDLAADQPDLTDLLDIQGDATAHEAGMWSPAARWPLVAIHAALLPNGDVLTYGTNEYAEGGSGFVYDRWTPSEGLAPDSCW